MKAVSASPTSAILSWLPPHRTNGRLVKFHVYLRISELNSGGVVRTVKRTLPSRSVSYEVPELKNREAYEAWVTGETSVGEGPPSLAVRFVATAEG